MEFLKNISKGIPKETPGCCIDGISEGSPKESQE